MLDHVERFTLGKPLYAAPSMQWTPILYPPGYFWLCAQLGRVMSLAIACRLVSVTSSALTTALVFVIARKLGASRFFSAVGSLLYLGCFGFVMQWFDAQRVDPLFLALAMTSALVALDSENVLRAAIAGLILGLAFFVKQQSAIFLVVVPAVLFSLRRAKHALAMAGAGALVIAPGYAWLQASSHGWFSYYVLHLPSTHGIEPKFIPGFVIYDLGRGIALVFGTAAALAALGRAIAGRLRKQPIEATPALVLSAFLLAAFVASTTTRLHPGSWDNNLIHWTAFACPAFAGVASRLAARAQSFACALAALQVVYFAPDPRRSIPTEQSRRASADVERRVHDLEAHGEVVLLTRGHVTTKRHAHYQALNDLLIAGDPLPDDFRAAIAARAYAAFIVDEIERLDLAQPFGTRPDIFDLIAANYFVAERLPDAPLPIIGHGSVPRWILRPRTKPLVLDHDGLVRRLAHEARLATSTSEGLDIEAR
jgi:hypothetical protein